MWPQVHSAWNRWNLWYQNRCTWLVLLERDQCFEIHNVCPHNGCIKLTTLVTHDMLKSVLNYNKVAESVSCAVTNWCYTVLVPHSCKNKWPDVCPKTKKSFKMSSAKFTLAMELIFKWIHIPSHCDPICAIIVAMQGWFLLHHKKGVNIYIFFQCLW